MNILLLWFRLFYHQNQEEGTRKKNITYPSLTRINLLS